MIPSLTLRQLRAFATDARPTSRAAQLRRAGYADGERRPRFARYWANR